MSASTTRRHPIQQSPRGKSRMLEDILASILDRLGLVLQLLAYDPECMWEDVLRELRDHRNREGLPYTTETFGRIIAAGENLDTYAVHAGRRTPLVIPGDASVRDQQMMLAATVLTAAYQQFLNQTGPFYVEAETRRTTRHISYLGRFVCLRSDVVGMVDLFGSAQAGIVMAVWGGGLNHCRRGGSESSDPLLVEAFRRLDRLPVAS